MLIPALIVEIAIMIAAPAGLGLLLRRRLRVPWTLFAAGALTYVAAQVVHLPLNAGLTALFRLEWMPKPPETWHLPFNAAVLGLTAGLCEEVARYLAYRLWIRQARAWPQALMFGAGHGGIESAIAGLLVALTLANMLIAQRMGVAALGVPPDQLAGAARQVEAFWSMPPYMPLLAAAERLMSILLHLSAAALVLHALRIGQLWPLVAAIAWHAALNAIVILVGASHGPVAAEASLAGLSLISVALLWATRRADRRNAPAPA